MNVGLTDTIFTNRMIKIKGILVRALLPRQNWTLIGDKRLVDAGCIHSRYTRYSAE